MAANTPFETELSEFTPHKATHTQLYSDAIKKEYTDERAQALFHRLNYVYSLIANYIGTKHLGSRDNVGGSRKYKKQVYTLMRVDTPEQVTDYGSRFIEPEALAIYETLEKCAECLRDYTEENAERLNKNLLNITQSADNGAQKEKGVSWLGSEAEQKGMIYQHIKKSILEIQQQLIKHYPKLHVPNQPASSSLPGSEAQVEPFQLQSISTELSLPGESAGTNDDIETYIQKTEEALKNCEITSGEEYNSTLDFAKEHYFQMAKFFNNGSKEEQEKYQEKFNSISNQLKPKVENLFYKKQEERRERERKRREELEYQAKIKSCSEDIATTDVVNHVRAYKDLAVKAMKNNPPDLESAHTYIEYAKSFLKYIKDNDTKDIWEELLNRLLPDLPENAPAPADPAISALHRVGILKAPSSGHTNEPPLRPFSRATLGPGK